MSEGDIGTTIIYDTDRRSAMNQPGESILETSLRHHIPHAHACGGNAICSSCRVLVKEGIQYCLPRNEAETRLAERLGFSENVRLACQTKLRPGKIVIRRPVLDEIDIELASNRDVQRGISSIGEEKEVSLLFADIEGYTSFTEQSQPYDVVHILNRYYYLMGKVVKKNNGYIMDYFGDGFLAIFGLEDKGNHALQAVRAGLEMEEALTKLNQYIKSMFTHPFRIRIGINSSTVIVGTIGIENMRKLAAIGDGVNLAARIEAANKQLGTRFLISDSTYQMAKDHLHVKGKHNIKVKGKSGAYQVWEVTGLAGV